MEESPGFVQLSLAAAMVLGLKGGRFWRDVDLRCINLLLTYQDGCRANCSYCGLARERPARETFIRVAWPSYPLEKVLRRLEARGERVGRVCLSMVQHPRALEDTLEILGFLRQATGFPLSVLVTPHGLGLGGLKALKEAGAETVGVALDAAYPELFQRLRGKAQASPLRWEVYWDTLLEARNLFGPGKVNCHIIVGLGETDVHLVELFGKLMDVGVDAYLFSFYPEPGSALARRRRPALRRWRRLQLIKAAFEEGLLEGGQCRFDRQGRLAGLEGSRKRLEELVEEGWPFMTDGCPDEAGQVVCTRPYGSYRPGEPFRDYPFRPTEADLSRIRRELRLEELFHPSRP